MAILTAVVDLGAGVGAWFTGRDLDGPTPALGQAGNLAHRRPHLPTELAATREQVARRIGQPVANWHFMQQVHGAVVRVVDEDTPPGAELRDVDAAVTALVDRPLVVQVADCVPVLFAGPTTVGVAHAGRAGVHRGVVAAAVHALQELGDAPQTVQAVIGPAIGGCCYEVPGDLQERIAAEYPAARASTTWGTPSLDLPSAVHAQLDRLGVDDVARLEDTCTRCDPRWFSHRRDPTSGRQVGIVVRTSEVAA